MDTEHDATRRWSAVVSLRDHVLLAASAERVWAVVGNLAEVQTWAPGVSSASVADGVRTCLLHRGGEVVETIVSFDDVRRRFQYSVIQGIPLRHHLATVDVLEVGTNRTLVLYGTDVEPVHAAPGIARAIRGSLEVLAAKFGVAERW
jgi:hypothetical protein